MYHRNKHFISQISYVGGNNIYLGNFSLTLFIWLHWVLAVACGIFFWVHKL